MKQFCVEGWLYHAYEKDYPKPRIIYFCAKNHKEAERIAKQYNWIWYRIEELFE